MKQTFCEFREKISWHTLPTGRLLQRARQAAAGKSDTEIENQELTERYGWQVAVLDRLYGLFGSPTSLLSSGVGVGPTIPVE